MARPVRPGGGGGYGPGPGMGAAKGEKPVSALKKAKAIHPASPERTLKSDSTLAFGSRRAGGLYKGVAKIKKQYEREIKSLAKTKTGSKVPLKPSSNKSVQAAAKKQQAKKKK